MFYKSYKSLLYGDKEGSKGRCTLNKGLGPEDSVAPAGQLGLSPSCRRYSEKGGGERERGKSFESVQRGVGEEADQDQDQVKRLLNHAKGDLWCQPSMSSWNFPQKCSAISAKGEMLPSLRVCRDGTVRKSRIEVGG